jgi:hypothetical protein
LCEGNVKDVTRNKGDARSSTGKDGQSSGINDVPGRCSKIKMKKRSNRSKKGTSSSSLLQTSMIGINAADVVELSRC